MVSLEGTGKERSKKKRCQISTLLFMVLLLNYLGLHISNFDLLSRLSLALCLIIHK